MPTLEDGGQILAYMAFCEVSQEQTPGTDAYAGDFGFKVLTAADPAEKTKKLNAEIAKRKTCDDGHHRHVFPGGDRCCALIVRSNSPRRETPQRSTKSLAE